MSKEKNRGSANLIERTTQAALLIGILLALPFNCYARPAFSEISARIKAHYEAQLFTLPPYIQRHYALRMYRMTGDRRYRYPIIGDLMLLANLLRMDIEGLNDPIYIERREQQIFSRFDQRFEKQVKRLALLKQNPGMAFSLALLANINLVHELNLLDTAFFATTRQALGYLKKQDFKTFILNHEAIKAFAPQFATYIYFLYDLGIVDLRAPFIKAFQNAFMFETDSELTDYLYAQKLYGMTHLIIGQSRTYQRAVPREKNAFVFDYLETHIEQILQRAKVDILAEVGIVFLLAGEKNHEVVHKVRQSVTAHFNETAELVVSPRNGQDLVKGEHRNTLAVMLLQWPERLYPGPDMRSAQDYNDFWLMDYLP